MIRNKKELRFYIMADMMMNRGVFRQTFANCLKEFFSPDYIMRYLIAMRKYSFYKHQRGVKRLLSIYYSIQYRRLGMKLGFSIGPDVFDYGVVLPHYGTIVVGDVNRIGAYAVLHTSTCITALPKKIGNNLYLSTGARITTGDNIGDNVMVSANSVVTNGFPEGNVLLVGMPAVVKKKIPAWYEYMGGNSSKRVKAIENLKMQMF